LWSHSSVRLTFIRSKHLCWDLKRWKHLWIGVNRSREVQFLESGPEHLEFMLLFSTFLLWGAFVRQTKENPVSIWKNLQHTRKLCRSRSILWIRIHSRLPVWFVLTEMVVKCGTNTEQLRAIATEAICARTVGHSLWKFGWDRQISSVSPQKFQFASWPASELRSSEFDATSNIWTPRHPPNKRKWVIFDRTFSASHSLSS
jgi:hypothetical protein